ncbi:hypothetical protein BDY19DRAFT_950387 [Irpex rosettiformis]|uniref:Uncharacterized protein n=1 Tax=Irpex rosettiformis TaxID=378272 RepID=A0ACB8U1U1_9APHY|nr:hypothetical protein BDY19DRAFT_950387 [Irpex rosettiformis]
MQGLSHTESTSCTSSDTQSHDPDFYFNDELAVFLVERRLFKVHRYFLVRDSEFFRGMFACPTPPGEEPEGTSDSRPISLHGVTHHEFRCLLRFFYDSMYRPSIITLQDWIALLSISTRYVFDNIRELAISEISKQMIDPVTKITLANRYHVPQWLSPAFLELCKRVEPLQDPEAEALGLRSVVRIARARELARDQGFITATQRSFFPHDRIYSYNDRGIMAVISNVWPECATTPTFV